MKRFKGFILPIIFLFFFFLAGFSVLPFQEGHCAQVTLTWDPNSESDLSGYKIYYGTSSGNYQWNIDVGNVNTYTVTGLDTGVTYYFVATAYNTQNEESGYSNEVVYTVPPCTYVISPSSASFSTSGGSGSVLVTTQAGCNWGTSSPAAWITVNSGSGMGSGTMTYTVTPNTGTTRTASLTIAGNVFTITESGIQTVTLTASAGAGGSISPSGQISVQQGSAQTFTITPNSGYRIVDVTVDGVSQGAITSYTFSAVSTSHTITAYFALIDPSPSGSHTVTTEIGIGSGHGTINPATQTVLHGLTAVFTVSPDSGYTATASGCSGSLTNNTFTTGAVNAACTVTVNFVSTATCGGALPVRIARTAVSYATIQEAYNASLNNDIIQAQAQYLTGNLSVNRNISVTVEGGYSCDFGTQTGNMTSLKGMIQTFYGGGTLAIRNLVLESQSQSGILPPAITTGSVQSLTSNSVVLNGTVNPKGLSTVYYFDWGTTNAYGNKIPLTSLSAGSGTSDVPVSANLTGLTPDTSYHYRLMAANSSGTTYGSDGTFKTSPEILPCEYSISPTLVNMYFSGGTNSFTITTTASCSWTAVSNASWITVTSPSGRNGTGNGTVSFTVSTNSGLSSRTGTISIAGKTFTVNQNAACSFSLSSSNTDVTAGGGSGFPLNITASNSTCSWTAVSNASWITVTFPSGGNGVSSGTVIYSVDANSGSARSGNISIAGHIFTVNQDEGPAGGLTLPVRIVRTGMTYATLQEAYNAAATGDILQVQAVNLTGDLMINRNISVTLEGGYLQDFSTYSGTSTSLTGMTQTFPGGGTMTVKNFILTNLSN